MQYGSKRGEKGVKLNNFNVQERKKSRISESYNRACAETIDYVNCCPEQHRVKLIRHLLMQYSNPWYSKHCSNCSPSGHVREIIIPVRIDLSSCCWDLDAVINH